MSEWVANAQTGLSSRTLFFFKRAVSIGFPRIWAWFHRLPGAKTNRLQTDKGSLRSQGVGSRHSDRHGRRRAVCLTDSPELRASALGLPPKQSLLPKEAQ